MVLKIFNIPKNRECLRKFRETGLNVLCILSQDFSSKSFKSNISRFIGVVFTNVQEEEAAAAIFAANEHMGSSLAQCF